MEDERTTADDKNYSYIAHDTPAIDVCARKGGMGSRFGFRKLLIKIGYMRILSLLSASSLPVVLRQ